MADERRQTASRDSEVVSLLRSLGQPIDQNIPRDFLAMLARLDRTKRGEP